MEDNHCFWPPGHEITAQNFFPPEETDKHLEMEEQQSKWKYDPFDSSTLPELGNKLFGARTQGIVKIKSCQNSLDPSVPG